MNVYQYDGLRNDFKGVTKVLKEIQTTLHEFINEVKVKPTANTQENKQEQQENKQEQQEKYQTQLTNIDKSTNELAELKTSLLSDYQHKRQQMIVSQSESDKLGDQIKMLIEKQDYHDDLYGALAYETRQLQATLSILDEKENKTKASEKTQPQPLQTQTQTQTQTQPLQTQTQPLQTQKQTQLPQERNIAIPEHTIYRFGIAVTNGVDVQWPELLIYKSNTYDTFNKAVEELPIPKGVKDMYLDAVYEPYSTTEDPVFRKYSGDDGTVYGICKVVIKNFKDSVTEYYVMCYGVKIY